jgi:hypothetical protein
LNDTWRPPGRSGASILGGCAGRPERGPSWGDRPARRGQYERYQEGACSVHSSRM